MLGVSRRGLCMNVLVFFKGMALGVVHGFAFLFFLFFFFDMIDTPLVEGQIWHYVLAGFHHVSCPIILKDLFNILYIL